MSIAERASWLSGTDPESQFGARVTVTDEEVRGAFKILSKIKQRIRKLSSSFHNLAAGLSSLGRKARSSTNITTSAGNKRKTHGVSAVSDYS